MFTWILAQWEEYHTGIMLYGNSYYGVLEANYCIAAVHVITYVVGPQLWRTPATKILPIKLLEGVRECMGEWPAIAWRTGTNCTAPPAPFAHLMHSKSLPLTPRYRPHLASPELNSLVIVGMVVVGSYQGFGNMYRVLVSFDYHAMTPKVRGAVCLFAAMPHCGTWASPLGSRCRLWRQPFKASGAVSRECARGLQPAQPPCPQEIGHKQLGVRAAWLHWLALMCQLGINTVWLWAPCDTPHLCRAQNLNIGIAYALTASSLIMAHMCKEPFQPPLWAIMALALGAVNSQLRVFDPLPFTAALGAVVFIGYIHYVLSVINQICDFLGIRCLSLQRPAGAAAAAALETQNGGTMRAPHTKTD